MIQLTDSWTKVLKNELEKPYIEEIKDFLNKEIKDWKIIYPDQKNIFNAFNATNFDDIKVIILWQDPYHWEWQAHGLSFSVQDWIKTPPSLKNIYKEIESDLNIKKDMNNGNLLSWADQWVLLLNACLSVEKSKPASHSKIWWQNFTDEVIKQISNKKENIVFLLWGAFAQSKRDLIDSKKHLILEAAHPSPFSAYRWFFWCKHFSKTNTYLKQDWIKEILW